MNCSLVYEKTTDYNKAKIVHFKCFWKNGTFQNASIFYYICLPKRAKELEVEFANIQDVKIEFELRTKELDVKIFITKLEIEKDNKVAQLYQKLINYDHNLKITLEKVKNTCSVETDRKEMLNKLNQRLEKLNNSLQLNAKPEDFEAFKNKKFWLEQAIILLKEIINN